MDKVRSLVIHDAGDLRIENCNIDRPGPGQVKLSSAVGGICGSDLHYYNHGGFGSVRLKQPMILGHEISAYVDEIGAGVNGLNQGDLVAVSPSRPCGQCAFCQQGLYNHCPDMRFYGSAMPFPHIQGAFREAIVVEAGQCVKANGITAAVAAMAEPLSVCLHAIKRAGEIRGKRVLVTGCGPIGVLTIVAAHQAGAGEIIATDLVANALEYAEKAGADKQINIRQTPDALDRYTHNKGSVDILFECSGSELALSVAMQTLRPRGIIIQLGLGGEMTIPMMQVTARELDIRGAFRFHEEFSTAVELMRSKKIDLTAFISHCLPFEQAETAFQIAGDRSQSMKVQLEFPFRPSHH